MREAGPVPGAGIGRGLAGMCGAIHEDFLDEGPDRTEERGALRRKVGRDHKAERAAMGAALALFARDHITREQFQILARPLDEALPWLLPKEPPHPYPEREREV